VLSHLLALVYALFLWWFSTGVIFYLNARDESSFRWSLLGGTVVVAVALYGFWASAPIPSTAAAYVAFTCGLLIWGWHTLTYYMGFITGPRKQACSPSCRGWRHFGHAIETSIYHELAIIATVVLLAALCWGEPNTIGLWTFVALWAMHVSAKLNVFLGVRNLNEEFLPRHLDYLKGFLTRKPINLLFPISVTAGTVATVLTAQAALDPAASAFAAAGWTLVAALLGLAVLEHWFMVLPLPAQLLWQWSIGSPKRDREQGDDPAAAGFGAETSSLAADTGLKSEHREENSARPGRITAAAARVSEAKRD